MTSTIASGTELTEDDYSTMSSGPSTELSAVASRGVALVDELANVEKYFKSGVSINNDPSGEEVFKKAKEAVTAFTMVINNAKVAALFATMNEPPNVAKGSFKARDRGYTPRKFEHGVSSNISSMSTPAKRAVAQSVGFADEEDVMPEVASAHLTPAKGKATPSVTSPAKSARSVSVGFADEDSGEETVTTPDESVRKLSVSSDDVVTNAELNGITYVSDFIESTEEYDFSTSMQEEIHECVRTRRAVSETARGLVGAIREAVANGKRDPHEALGYKDGIVDMSNPVLQWLISQAG